MTSLYLTPLVVIHLDNHPAQNKILIFGYGKQAMKYVHFFGSQGCRIDIVSASGKQDPMHYAVSSIQPFDEFISKIWDLDTHYQTIILAVAPISEQERVLRWILTRGFSIPCIIEKPVCEDFDLLQRVVKMDNITFFIDETCLAPSFRTTPIASLHIRIAGDIDAIEHSFWFFVLRKDFPTLLQMSRITLIQADDSASLHYQIDLTKRHTIVCDRGRYLLGRSLLAENLFAKNLSFLLTSLLWEPVDNCLFKTHILLLSRYIRSHSFV